ncbi:MAG: PIN domain-containing protein [Methanobacteriota archaeon]
MTLRRTEADRVAAALRGVTTYAMDRGVAARAGALEAELESEGHAIGPADAIVAATALHYDEPVVTRNTKQFSRVPGLRVVTYEGRK